MKVQPKAKACGRGELQNGQAVAGRNKRAMCNRQPWYAGKGNVCRQVR